MYDPAIREFFIKRMEDWLKKKKKDLPQTNTSLQEDKIHDLEVECEQVFAYERWLPDAARRAGQISFSSHPCTFSHPSARKKMKKTDPDVTPIIANAVRKPDGYLRSGNVSVENDALGNAAALDVYRFLMLRMEDGKYLLQHIEQDSSLATELLAVETESYETLKEGFLAMTSGSGESVTSSKIKQVYYPVGSDGYHQLSVLSNSGMIYELRHRIDKLRFSDRQKELRELKRTNQYSEQGYSEIYDITTIGYGGAKPQNVSVLNNKNGGKAHLLLSVPPHLEKWQLRFPTKNFFSQSIRFSDCAEPLRKLHGIFTSGVDSAIPRRNLEVGRDHRFEEILDAIIQRMMALRTVSIEQYREQTSDLDHYQKIWLCEQYRDEREQDDGWLDSLCEDIALWTYDAYKKVVKKPVALGSAERVYIRRLIDANREVLR